MRGALLIALAVASLGAYWHGDRVPAAAARGAVSAQAVAPLPAPEAVLPARRNQAPHAARSPAAASMAARIAATEAAVQQARRQGQGEQEVYRLRATQLPAAEVAALNQLDEAEAAWNRRVEDFRQRCAAQDDCSAAGFTPQEQAMLAHYKSAAGPRLVAD